MLSRVPKVRVIYISEEDHSDKYMIEVALGYKCLLMRTYIYLDESLQALVDKEYF